MNGRKLIVFEAADKVNHEVGHRTEMSRDDEDPLVTQREEVGAFPDHAVALDVAHQQWMQVFPVGQVGGLVQEYSAANILNARAEHHQPAFAVFPDEGVAKVA